MGVFKGTARRRSSHYRRHEKGLWTRNSLLVSKLQQGSPCGHFSSLGMGGEGRRGKGEGEGEGRGVRSGRRGNGDGEGEG